MIEYGPIALAIDARHKLCDTIIREDVYRPPYHRYPTEQEVMQACTIVVPNIALRHPS
jgi:hypothetical protein